MKLGPVNNFDKRNKTLLKTFDDDVMSSLKLIFLLIVTFYLTKTENRTKESLTQLSQYCVEYRYYFC